MIKSPLRYPGGKSRAVDLISTLVPKFDEFREPFLGGGSIFIYLKQKFPNKTFWVNDLYLELFKFWEMSQRNVDDVIEKVMRLKIKNAAAFSKSLNLEMFSVRNLCNSFPSENLFLHS